MKALRIIQSIGYFALFLASAFNLVNQIAENIFLVLLSRYRCLQLRL